MGLTVEVTDDTFESEVTSSDLPVLVDFWAEWCAPCKMIAPIVEDLAGEYDGKVKFAKMDVDSNTNVPSSFGIRSIPTLLIFKDGSPVGQIVGAVSKTVLKSRLEDAIK